MNVLMLGPDRSVHGGISAVVNGYYEAGLDEKINLKYIGTMKEGSKAYKLAVAAKAYMEFSKELPNADVIHVNVASDNSFRRKSIFVHKAHKANKKIIIHQHGGDFKNFFANENDDAGRDAILNTICMAEKLIVLSDGWKEYFESILKEKTEKPQIVVLNNSIRIPSDTEASGRAYGSHNLLFLGRICRDKGIEELLNSFERLSNEFTDMHLYLGGIYEDEGFKKKIEAHREQITFLGWIDGDKKTEYLKKCDILVLPSYYEGFPVCVVEGMAYGCSVVATRVGAIPEIIEDGIDGILIQPRDEGSLTEGLRELLGDDLFMERIGNAARAKVTKKYNINNTIDRLIEIYEN